MMERLGTRWLLWPRISFWILGLLFCSAVRGQEKDIYHRLANDLQNNSTVYFVAGDYVLNQTVYKTGISDFKIIGEPGTRIKIAVKDGNGLDFTDCSDFTVSGIEFYSTDDTLAAARAFILKNNKNFVFADNTFHHFTVASVRVSTQSENGVFVRNRIRDFKTENQINSFSNGAVSTGLSLSNITRGKLLYNRVSNIDTVQNSSGSRGIYISSPGTESEITGNVIENASGIKFVPAVGSGTAFRSIISNNIVRESRGAAILIGNAEDVILDNNVVQTKSGNGLEIGKEGTAKNIRINGMFIDMNHNTGDPVYINNAGDIWIDNLHIKNHGGGGAWNSPFGLMAWPRSYLLVARLKLIQCMARMITYLFSIRILINGWPWLVILDMFILRETCFDTLGPILYFPAILYRQ